MRCVKNNIVKMNWDVDGFLVNDYVGFVAAIHNYHGLIVVFQDGVVWAFSQGPGKTSDLKETVDASKSSYKFTKTKGEVKVTRGTTPEEYSEYTVICDGGIPEDGNVSYFGLTDEDVEDILKRVDDLDPYFEEEFQEM